MSENNLKEEEILGITEGLDLTNEEMEIDEDVILMDSTETPLNPRTKVHEESYNNAYNKFKTQFKA